MAKQYLLEFKKIEESLPPVEENNIQMQVMKKKKCFEFSTYQALSVLSQVIHIACQLKLFINVVTVTWPEKFDFVLVPEHDVTCILT